MKRLLSTIIMASMLLAGAASIQAQTGSTTSGISSPSSTQMHPVKKHHHHKGMVHKKQEMKTSEGQK